MMDKIFDYLKNTKLLISTVISLIIFIIGVYEGYKEIKSDIATNTKLIEVSQMQMLAPIVRQMEKNPCTVTDLEWEEYETNYSNLFDLRVKYKNLNPKAFNIMKRLEQDKPSCKR